MGYTCYCPVRTTSYQTCCSRVWTTSYQTCLLSSTHHVFPYIIVKHGLYLTRHVIVEYGLHRNRHLFVNCGPCVPDMLFIAKYEPHILGINLIQKMQLGCNHQHHIYIHSKPYLQHTQSQVHLLGCHLLKFSCICKAS